MKRMTLLVALAASSLLAACGTTPSASLTYGDASNPGRVTGVSGLESQDVANVMNYGAYTTTKSTAPQKKVCSFTAVEGQTMSFSGVASIECFAPEADSLARPVQAKGAFERNTAAIGGLVKDTKDVALGYLLYKDRQGSRESNERLQESNNALEASENANRAAFNQSALDAAAVPTVIFTPPTTAGGEATVTPVP